MRIVVTTFLAVSVVLSACAPRVGTSAVGKLSPAAFTDANTGVVVFSVSAQERRSDNQTMLMVFDQASHRPIEPDVRIWVDSKEEPSDFSEYHGIVNAVRLPPGSYVLMPGTLNATVRSRPTFLFDVRAGETTYAGELHMSWNSQREAVFTIRDRHDRDIAVAREKNPAVEARRVVKRLLRAGEALTR